MLHFVTISLEVMHVLYRKVYDELIKWKNDDHKKALCILGARQIGKTTIIREFGNNEYDCFVELNFILNEKASRIFDGDLDVNNVIEGITALTRKELIPGKTLILFDEIQECPNARTAIKFLVEDGRFDYIESGSLLGVKNKIVKSYPVGFEKIYYMYPLDFMEFLKANGIKDSTIKLLKKSYDDKAPVLDNIHTIIMKLFYAYIVVGGMPEVVNAYISTHDIGKVISLQNAIIELYKQDISKYSLESDGPKIRAIYDAIPSQLNDKNRRFNISAINSNARLLRYEDSFNWLIEAGVVNPCYNVNEPVGSLSLNEKRNLFKLYSGDTGLLCAQSMNDIQFDILQGNTSVNMGSVLENVMAQLFVANGFSLNYFDSHKYGELDFVLQKGVNIDYVEIKSGNDYKKHAALNKIKEVKDWKHNNNIVFCKSNIFVEDDITYYPWYMAMFYKGITKTSDFEYKIDIGDL